jgi:hypothetical protein
MNIGVDAAALCQNTVVASTNDVNSGYYGISGTYSDERPPGIFYARQLFLQNIAPATIVRSYR